MRIPIWGSHFLFVYLHCNCKNNIMEKKDILFKCSSLGDDKEDMLFIAGSQIMKITPQRCLNNDVKLFVDYYDDEFCINSTFICDKVEQINE